jgi:hypothetical protein
MKITLDMNCIVALEENRPEAPFLQQLISLHNAGSVNLRVTAISGAERRLDRVYSENFAEFKQKIAAIGLEDIEIFPTLAYVGLAFLDFCILAGEEEIASERRIHEILFPTIEFDYSQYCKHRGIEAAGDIVDPKWRNAKCDVLTLWGHINFGGDIFVTSDRNFHKQTKKARLISLGAGMILTPQETVDFLNSVN